MAKPKNIKKIIEELNPNAIFVKGFDEALLGTAKTIGGPTVATYDADKCLKISLTNNSLGRSVRAVRLLRLTLGCCSGVERSSNLRLWGLGLSLSDKLSISIED